MRTLFTAITLGLLTVAHAQETLRMTAPAGTKLTGTIQSSTTMTVVGIDVQPKPNVRLTAQKLAEYRKTFAVFPELPAVNQTMNGTLEVLPAQASGGVPVQLNIDVPVPDKDPLKLSMRTVYLPDGTFTIEVDPSSDATVQQVLGSVKEVLAQPEMQLLYTKAWTPGEVATLQQSIPMEKFMGTLPYRITGEFKLNTTLGFVQRNAAGEAVFQMNGRNKLSEIRAYDENNHIVMKIFVANVVAAGESRIRADGLQSHSQLDETMDMTLVMNMPELPVTVTTKMKLNVQQIQNWQ